MATQSGGRILQHFDGEVSQLRECIVEVDSSVLISSKSVAGAQKQRHGANPEKAGECESGMDIWSTCWKKR